MSILSHFPDVAEEVRRNALDDSPLHLPSYLTGLTDGILAAKREAERENHPLFDTLRSEDGGLD